MVEEWIEGGWDRRGRDAVGKDGGRTNGEAGMEK